MVSSLSVVVQKRKTHYSKKHYARRAKLATALTGDASLNDRVPER